MISKKISALQAEVLVRYMEDNPRMICGAIDAGFTKEDKEKEWRELTDTLNGLGCSKIKHKWIKTWSDLKIAAKKKVGVYGREVKTKGEDYTLCTTPNPLDLRIVKLIAPHILEGISYLTVSSSTLDNGDEKAESGRKFEAEFANCSKNDVNNQRLQKMETNIRGVKEELFGDGGDNSDHEDFDVEQNDFASESEDGGKDDERTCQYCLIETFNDLNDLKNHYKYCRIRKKILNVESTDTETWTQTQHGERINNKHVKCKMCNITFFDKDYLSTHRKISHSKKYICNLCDEKFYDSSELVKHLRSHSIKGTDNDAVDSKQQVFPKRDLADFMALPNKKFYFCRKCNEKFNTTVSFEKHALTHLVSKIRQTTNETEEMIKIQKSVLVDDTLINNNRAIYTPRKPFVCILCDQGFAFECNLKIHKKLHNVESFTCKICLRTFPSENHLADHEVLHEKGNIYSCIVCDMSFNDSTHLLDHLRTHECNKIFECDVCYRRYYSACKLKEHTNYHIKGTFICDECKKVFSNKMMLQRHIKIHSKMSKTGNFPCSFCDQILCTVAQLNKHKRTIHPGRRRHKCELCERSFKSVLAVEKHMSCHKGIKKYICGECGKKFALKLSLEAHIAIHGRFQCQSCGKTFSSKTTLIAHELTHGSIRYTCEICGKGSKTFQIHKKHLDIHKNREKIHECQICNKSYTHIGLLRAHNKRHSDNRPYSCTQCDWSFKTRGSLKTHFSLKHTKDWSHICSICGEAFPLSSLLKYHEYKHKGKPHVCDVCGRSFNIKYSLKLHYATHTGDMPHCCFVCGKKFNTKFKLRRHEQTHQKQREGNYC